MTKSQNTKNEQQKDLCITSEQLTEQWKKGELPEGWFWVEGCRDKEIYAYTSEYLNHMYRPKNSDRIIEQVPSYDEWLEKTKSLKVLAEAYCKEKQQNAQLKEQINKCYLDAINRGTANTVKAVKEFGMPERIEELVKENAQLKERNDSLNNRDINLCRIANGIRDENFALKELLKDARNVLKMVDTYYGDYDSTKGFLIVERIDEALQ